MSWLKDSLLDLIFLGVILSTFFYESDSMFIIIWIYTGLLLLSKSLALFMPFLRKRAAGTSTPDVVYHIIYISSFSILFFLEKWYLGAAWVLIWILSIVLVFKSKKEQTIN